MTGTPEPTMAVITSSWPVDALELHRLGARAHERARPRRAPRGTPLRKERNGMSPIRNRVGAPRRDRGRVPAPSSRRSPPACREIRA